MLTEKILFHSENFKESLIRDALLDIILEKLRISLFIVYSKDTQIRGGIA